MADHFLGLSLLESLTFLEMVKAVMVVIVHLLPLHLLEKVVPIESFPKRTQTIVVVLCLLENVLILLMGMIQTILNFPLWVQGALVHERLVLMECEVQDLVVEDIEAFVEMMVQREAVCHQLSDLKLNKN